MRQGGAAAAGEQVETIHQAGRDLGRGKYVDARRCQLDRQGNAVEPGTDLGYRGSVLQRQLEIGLGELGALLKQAHGCRSF